MLDRLSFPEEAPTSNWGFDVLQRLGRGAAGEVYLARSKGGRLVAIKVVGVATEDEHDSAAEFAREASLCARLNHKNIVQVRAFIEKDGFAALIFDYVPGVALGRLVRLCGKHGVRLPDPAGWLIVERVLTALSYAHAFRDEDGSARPIAHRDLSPANVLVAWDGEVKLADFGIAKMIGVSSSTRMGLVKGTLGCMAPEQARGDAVSERADVYAAGLLAWRLATGRAPFAKHLRDEFELLRAMRNPRIKPLGVLRPDLPDAIVRAVDAALETDPAKRTITAGEFAEVIRHHFKGEEGEAKLRQLLEKWRPALERSVRRNVDAVATGELSAKLQHTLSYEQVALSLDEDPSLDAPTFEAHALPADPALLESIADSDSEAIVPAALPAARASSAELAPLDESLVAKITLMNRPSETETGRGAAGAESRDSSSVEEDSFLAKTGSSRIYSAQPKQTKAVHSASGWVVSAVLALIILAMLGWILTHR